MSASLFVLLASAAPTLSRGISLRPRLGLFPVVFFALCLLWVGLMRYALPGFTRRLTWLFVVLSGVAVLSLLPRFLWRGGSPGATHWFYLWVVLPATAVQVAMMAGLLSAPLWVVLGRLVKRRLQREPAPEAQPLPTLGNEPATQALDRPAPRALWWPLGRLTGRATPGQPLLTRRTLLTGAPWVLPGGR